MRARILWIVAALAVVAGVAWWATRGDPERQDTTSARSENGRAPSGDAGTTSGPPRTIPPPRRSLPPPGAPPPTEARDFDDDQRDAAWADGMEKDLGARLEAMQLEATDVECRERSCRLELQAKDLDAVSAAIARLEEPEPAGLVGVVDGIVVTAPENLPTGAVRVVIYASVER
jgi:hypothetical protein